MKFVIILGLLISVSQLSTTVQQQFNSRLDVKPIMVYPSVDIDIRNHGILDNSWVKGTISPKASPDNLWPYERIKYQRAIPKDSPIRLNYSVQYKQWSFFYNNWFTVYHDSVLLCDTSNFTQDASIISLVRELLVIPEGCPVPAGHVRNTRGVNLPFRNREFFFNVNHGQKELRILATLLYDYTYPIEKIFTGEFYLVYPAVFGIKVSS